MSGRRVVWSARRLGGHDVRRMMVHFIVASTRLHNCREDGEQVEKLNASLYFLNEL